MHTIKDLKYEDAVSQLRNIDIVESLRHGNFAMETAALTVRRPPNNSTTVVRCQICDKPGHTAKKCYWRNNNQSEKPPSDPKSEQNTTSINDIKCYNCGKRGHYAKKCNKPDRRLQKSGQTNSSGQKRQSEGKSGGTDPKKAKTNNNGGKGNFDSNEEYAHMLSSSDTA